MPTISDVMQKDVEVVRPDATLREAIMVLCEGGISGAPVQADNGKLVGIISEYALMDVLFDPELKNAKVSDHMTPEVHSLTEEDTLTHAVHKFIIYGVRRLPVMRGEELVGIVSRRDLMRACLDFEEPLVAPLQEFIPELASKTAYAHDGINELVDLA